MLMSVRLFDESLSTALNLIFLSQVSPRSVPQSQVSPRSVSDQSQISLRLVPGLSQALRSLRAYFVSKTEPKILRLVISHLISIFLMHYYIVYYR